jgi:hypothetical protein
MGVNEARRKVTSAKVPPFPCFVVAESHKSALVNGKGGFKDLTRIHIHDPGPGQKQIRRRIPTGYGHPFLKHIHTSHPFFGFRRKTARQDQNLSGRRPHFSTMA